MRTKSLTSLLLPTTTASFGEVGQMTTSPLYGAGLISGQAGMGALGYGAQAAGMVVLMSVWRLTRCRCSLHVSVHAKRGGATELAPSRMLNG